MTGGAIVLAVAAWMLIPAVVVAKLCWRHMRPGMDDAHRVAVLAVDAFNKAVPRPLSMLWTWVGFGVAAFFWPTWLFAWGEAIGKDIT